MATGYSSSQSFARAFRNRTGVAPTAIQHGVAVDQKNVGGSEVKLVIRDAVHVVALRREGGAYVALNALFQRVWDWADGVGAIGGLQGLYGIPLDDPESVSEHRLRYDACLALGPVAPPPPPLRLISLPDGPHAQLRHRGSYDDLEAIDQWLVGTWLLESGFDPADAPLFHHFHNDPESTRQDDLITDILLPLKATKEI